MVVAQPASGRRSSPRPPLRLAPRATTWARDGGGADRTDSRGHSASIIAWQTEKSGNGEGPSLNLSLDGEEKLVAIVEIPDGKAVAFNVSFEELK